MDHRKQSFTLIELMIVVVIIGIMAGVGIPSYQKAIEKNEERTAVVKLQAMRAGMIIYKAKHGSYPAFDMPDLASIDQNLGLNIVPDTITYQCLQNGAEGETNVCQATSPNGWVIHWHNIPDQQVIHCWRGGSPCPTCKAPGAGGCGFG